MIRRPEVATSLPPDADDKPAIRAAVINLAWPVVAEMGLQTATQVIDMAMVGRLGPVAIAAVGLSFQPLMLAMAVFAGVAVGTTALVARSVGAGDRETAGLAAGQGLAIASLMAFSVCGLAIWQAANIVSIMGAEPEVVLAGASYIRTLMPGGAFMLVGMILAGSLRGAGDTRTPMKVAIWVNIANVALNYVLIFGHLGFPALGLVGAALGTSISRSAGALALVVLAVRGRSVITLRAADVFRIDAVMIRRIFRIGIPAALERLIMSASQVLYVRMVASLGTVAFAAHTIAINAESLSFMPGIGLSAAATTLVGQALGAKSPRRAEASARETMRLGALIMGSMGVVMMLVPGLLMRIYTSEPEVIAYGVVILRIAAVAQVPMGMSFILAGGLRGAGDTRSVLLISMAGAWGVRLSLTALLVFGVNLGLTGAWIAMVLDWGLRSTITYIHFGRGRWKEIEV